MSTFQNIDAIAIARLRAFVADLSADLSDASGFINSFETLVMDGLVQEKPERYPSVFGAALEPAL